MPAHRDLLGRCTEPGCYDVNSAFDAHGHRLCDLHWRAKVAKPRGDLTSRVHKLQVLRAKLVADLAQLDHDVRDLQHEADDLWARATLDNRFVFVPPRHLLSRVPSCPSNITSYTSPTQHIPLNGVQVHDECPGWATLEFETFAGPVHVLVKISGWDGRELRLPREYRAAEWLDDWPLVVGGKRTQGLEQLVVHPVRTAEEGRYVLLLAGGLMHCITAGAGATED